MIETAKKWMELRESLRELNVIAVSLHSKYIQLDAEGFRDNFRAMVTELNVDYLGQDERFSSPYEISIEVDGIKFLALFSLKELEEHFPELIPIAHEKAV